MPLIEADLCAFDTEDDSKRFSDARQNHPGYEKVCTQIAALDFRTQERFHYRPKVTSKRRRGRWQENKWDVEPFLAWLESRGPGTRVYAHNLAYDIGNIWRDRLDELDLTLVGNRLVRARWRNVHLLDSSNVWPMPLAKVGDSVGLKKLEMDEESEEYVFRDVEIVGAAMSLAERIAIEFDADMKSTLGSLSVSIWNGGVLRGSNWQCSSQEVRQAYYGGRVELFRTHAQGDDLYYCDINSLYPSCMLEEFPDEANAWFDEKSLDDAERLLCSRRKLFGVAHVELEVPLDTLIAPLPTKREGTGEVCFPVGPVSGWWTVHEIRHALARGAKLKKLHDCYGSRTGTRYYAEFMETFYRRRKAELDKGEEGDQGRILFYKLLMNNLYGQMGMRGTVSRTLRLTPDMIALDENGEEYLTKPGIPFGGKLLADVEIPLPAHVNYLHAAYVTSYGRLKLMKYMELVGGRNLIYCDTDSIFFKWNKAKLPFPISTELGEMKIEDRPKWVETRAPKMYRYEVAKGVKTKAKGVPKRMQDEFYDKGAASFWQPFRLRESIAHADRIPNPMEEDVKVLGVWREVSKRVVSAYDKKRLSPDGVSYVPKTMVDIGPDHETVPLS